MKREHSYIIGALALAGAILLAEADTVKNGFVEVVGEGARANGDRDVVLHEPEDPSEVKVSTQAGWRFTDPQDAAFLHHVGATDLIHLVNESKESEATIKITDDWEHTCEKTNWEEHVSAPKLVVGGADHALFLLKPDDVGVFLETNCTASAGEDGIHNVWTECKPCRHPDCRGRNPLKWVEEKKIHAPDQVEGTVRASGRILVDPDRDDGYYLLEGPHELLYTASFDLEECAEHLCVGGAVTNTTWDVCRLSVTNTPYLGIDLTDEGKKTNAVGIAEARYGYRPKNTTASYQWEFISPRHGVIASQDDEKGTARLESARPAEPSETYEGDQVICHATLTEMNPPDGHNPCVASAEATSPITVVKVDVVMDDVEEDKEETEGAMLYYIPDAENGEWTEEGTNDLRKIRFVCEPDDGEMLKHEIAVTAPEGLLFEKVGKEYYPAKETYTVEELNKKEFRVHGHRRSEKYLGDEIEAVHVLSGAKDKVKLTIFGRPLLVPDYDRKNGIDDADVGLAKVGKEVFRFWINDDDDRNGLVLQSDGEIQDWQLHKSIPDGNCKNDKVDGLSDLVDLTAVWLDISEVFPAGSDELKEKIEWRLESDCYKAVWTFQNRGNAHLFRDQSLTSCGPKFNQSLHEASVCELNGSSGVIPSILASQMANSDGSSAARGVVMLEGYKPGTRLELVGLVKESGRKMSKGALKTKVSPVADMIRWMNLRGVVSSEHDTGVRSNYEEEPPNRPDDECKRHDRRHFVFVHGYNINKNEAIGWACEVFKRLWQSGYRGRFTGVDWYGDDTQINLKITTFCPNYWGNVVHAFDTASALKKGCDQLDGEKVIMAHSLGNMLVCSAMVDEGMTNNVSRYYMMNAAVPIQALTDHEHKNAVMIPNAWSKVDPKFMAAHWHELFPTNDFRSKLNWVARFKGLPDAVKTVSLYSLTENVVRDSAAKPAWKWQETWKGALMSSFFGCEVGWSENNYHSQFWENRLYSKEDVMVRRSSRITEEQMTTEPLFAKFETRGKELHDLARYYFPDAQEGEEKHLRAQILGCCIPATSLCIGANKMDKNLKVTSYEYTDFRTGSRAWPRDNFEWHHSDFVVVAYYYITRLYDKLQEGL